MVAPTDSSKRQLSYFHALSKAPSESSQNVYESLYKSAHSLRATDVWGDAVAYAVDVTAADSEAGSNPAVTKHTLVSLTEVPGSNGQAYYLEVGGVFIKP